MMRRRGSLSGATNWFEGRTFKWIILLEITVEKRVSDFFSPLFESEYKIIVFNLKYKYIQGDIRESRECELIHTSAFYP